MWLANFLCAQKAPPIAAPSVILVPGPCSCLRVSDELASGKDPSPMLARLAGIGWKSSGTNVRLTTWKTLSRASRLPDCRWSRPGSAGFPCWRRYAAMLYEFARVAIGHCARAALPASRSGFPPGQPCQRCDRAWRPGSLARVAIGLGARSLPARAITCHSKNVLVKSAQTRSVDTSFASRSSLARSRGRFLW